MEAIMTSIRIHDTFYHDDRHFRTKGAQDFDKIIGSSIATILGAVRHRIDDITDSILNTSKSLCDIEIHACIA